MNSPAPRSKARQRRLLVRGLAVLVGLAPIILIEAGLRLAGIGDPARAADPLAGFAGSRPLFEQVGEKLRTVRSREPFFNPQEFAAQKPANGYRVFCFGGSTIYGHPYQSETAIPKWLELELAARNPGRRVEVVNGGGVSYASYRILPLVREALTHAPDLIVVATGENEFLEDRSYRPLKERASWRRWLTQLAARSHTVNVVRQWLEPPAPRAADAASLAGAEVKPRLDDSRTGYASYHRDDAWRAQVVGQFQDSLRAIASECRQAGVPLVLITLGSNLRDCPPYKAEHKPGLAPAAEAQWQAEFEAASALDRDQPARALERYAKAEALDAEHALLAWRMARCHDRLGNFDRARDYFIRAKDLDVCPLRMLEEVYRFQHALAAEMNIPVVDARKLLESRSPEGIPGNDCYVDHVHPNLIATQWIARELAAAVRRINEQNAPLDWSENERREAARKHLAGLDPNYFSNGRRRVGWLENWAQRQRLAEEAAPVDARGHLRLGIRQLDLGDREAAWHSFTTAMRLEPATAAPLIAHIQKLTEQGRPDTSRWLIHQLNQLIQDPKLREALNRTARDNEG